MPFESIQSSVAERLDGDLSRRQFLVHMAAGSALASIASRLIAERANAEDATPTPTPDPARVTALIALSTTLCGGGNFDPDRAAMLLQLISADPKLNAGLEALLATPPVEGQPLPAGVAQATAAAILGYWYAGGWSENAVQNRGTVYYQLTAWQAMYTFSWAVCHGFGIWSEAPKTNPLVPIA